MRLGRLALIGLALLGCGGQTITARPCTTCPNVSGNYAESIETLPANKAICGELLSRGGTDTVVVTQAAGSSEIHIRSELGGPEITATLNEDASITVEPLVASTSTGVAGTLALSGRFHTGTDKRFDGSWVLTLKDNPCVIDSKPVSQSLTVKTQWTFLE